MRRSGACFGVGQDHLENMSPTCQVWVSPSKPISLNGLEPQAKHTFSRFINAALPWVAGVCSTHGLPEAVIVIGYADKAAL